MNEEDVMGRGLGRDELQAGADIVRDAAQRIEDAVADLVERGQPAAAAAGEAVEEVLGRLDSP